MKLPNWFRRKPEHEHDLIEFPTDMGRKLYRKCRGCDFSETVPASAAVRINVAPIAAAVRDFQRGVEAAVEKHLRGKP